MAVGARRLAGELGELGAQRHSDGFDCHHGRSQCRRRRRRRQPARIIIMASFSCSSPWGEALLTLAGRRRRRRLRPLLGCRARHQPC